MSNRWMLMLSLAGALAGCSSRGLGTDGDGGVTCAGLGEADCKSNHACIADYCTECSCTPTFVGCRLPSAPTTPCPALGCAQPNCGCDGLDQAACQAASQTMGCTANFCPDCHGGQTYVGCTGPNAGEPFCPNACVAGCHDAGECTSGQSCRAPGEPQCGGACLIPPPCQSDGDCGGGAMICDVPVCNCNGGAKGCIQGCSSVNDCGDGEVCDATHRCVPMPCGSCPAHFACVGGGCQRQTCTSDGSCGTGFCVEGACYDALGMCQFPVP